MKLKKTLTKLWCPRKLLWRKWGLRWIFFIIQNVIKFVGLEEVKHSQKGEIRLLLKVCFHSMLNINKVFNTRDININKAFILMIRRWVRLLELMLLALTKPPEKSQMNRSSNNGKKKWKGQKLEIMMEILPTLKKMFQETNLTLLEDLIPSILDKILLKMVVVLPWIQLLLCLKEDRHKISQTMNSGHLMKTEKKK